MPKPQSTHETHPQIVKRLPDPAGRKPPALKRDRARRGVPACA